MKRESALKNAFVLLTLFSLLHFFVNLYYIRQNDKTAVFGVDFIAYYTAAKLMKTGLTSEIYQEVGKDLSTVDSGIFLETARQSGFESTPTRYVYLPIFLAPFQMLVGFDFPTAAIVWLIFNLALLTAVILLQWGFVKDSLGPGLAAMFSISVNLLSFPLFYALKLGQTTLLIYLVICLIYHFARKGKNGLAGVLLGLIVCLKYSPFLFALYFLYRKKYKLFFSALLTAAVLVTLSIITYGYELHEKYWRHLMNLSDLGIAGWSNQSLYGFFIRQFTSANVLYFNPIKVPNMLQGFRYVFILLILIAIIAILKWNQRKYSESFYPLEYTVILLGLLIFPSISWLHYFTYSILTIILVIGSYLEIDNAVKLRVIFPIALGYSMIALHPDYFRLMDWLGQNFGSKLLVSFPFFGACLLLFINVWLIICLHLQTDEKNLTSKNCRLF